MTAIVLPQGCPICRVWLQAPLRDGDGVRPHFEACHPGTPVPSTQEGLTHLAQ